jgi:hypothetical protein
MSFVAANTIIKFRNLIYACNGVRQLCRNA